jgi:tetratricopeptide (TPR) repeat protein/TolB-like protein
VLGSDPLTKTGSTLGTVGYMSPEQVRGEKVDHRTDLFSLGVVLYELITGHSSFKSESEAATLHAITDTKPDLLARFRREVPDGMQTIIDKALDKDITTRYQHADELRADLGRIGKGPHTDSVIHRRHSRLPITSLAIAGLVILALILKPWRFEISPTREVQTSANWLAVMYFDNVAEPADSRRLGEIATNLLITGLSQSEYLKVMSSQRLYDLLKQVGKEGVKTIDRVTASEIATRADAKWMLTGSILQSEPVLVLTSQLIDVSNGGVIASQRITGNQGENIFAVIDRLTEDVKKTSALPGGLKTEPQIRVADVTTHSPEAYRYYLEGIDYRNKFYYEDGRRSLQKAIEYDSTFALAYAMLAKMSDGKDWEDAIAMAVKYSDHVSDRDRLRIMRMDADLHGDYLRSISISRDYLGRYSDDKEEWYQLALEYFNRGFSPDSASVCCKRALALDPNFTYALNILAYSYNALGQHDKAVETINRCIALTPNEANPYDSRGDLYASAGNLDSAIGSYRKALIIKPNFLATDVKLGLTYIFARKFAEAERLIKAYIGRSDKQTRGISRFFLATIPTYQGKFRDALRVLNECTIANKLDGVGEANLFASLWIANIHDIMGQFDSALAACRTSIGLLGEAFQGMKSASTRDNRFQIMSYYATLLFRAGDTAEAKVQIGSVEDSLNTLNPWAQSEFWTDKGVIAYEQKDFGRSIEFLTRADSISPGPGSRRWLAEACLEAGNPGRAVSLLENLTSDYSQLQSETDFTILPRALYLLGQAYEQTGSVEKARETYERFLDIWKNADPGIKEIDDAKVRLARLKGKS